MKAFKSLLFFTVLSFVLTGNLSSQTLTVATYNIRMDNRNDSLQGDGWKQRSPALCQLIAYHDFDIFGTQEGFYHQLEDMLALLPGYAYTGVGRDDGKQKGEYAAIFYKKEKFRLLDQGNFWLSENPDKPNLGWDAACVRICSWGKFEEIATGFRFLFFNVHMDHVGVVARREGAKLILNRIQKMSENQPVILTGDFNVDQRNESYTLLNTSGIMKDAYEKSPLRYAMNGTFNSFETDRKTDSRIDHIFLSNEFKVSRYGILTDVYWTEDAKKPGRFVPRIPSDHYPVVVKINR